MWAAHRQGSCTLPTNTTKPRGGDTDTDPPPRPPQTAKAHRGKEDNGHSGQPVGPREGVVTHERVRKNTANTSPLTYLDKLDQGRHDGTTAAVHTHHHVEKD